MRNEPELHTELVAKPKTTEPLEPLFHCKHCMVPIEMHTESSFKNYSGSKSCELYSDWHDLLCDGKKHTRDELLAIVETALKTQYPDVSSWSRLVDELLFIDIDDLGVLTRENGLIWWA